MQLVPILAASHRVVVTNPMYLASVRRRRLRPASLAEVPVGANIPMPPDAAAERPKRRRALVGEASPVVGELGVANAYRRPEDVIAVVEAIQPDGRFLCIGGLRESEARALLIQELFAESGLDANVIWTGFLPMDELASALSVIDVYVHTSSRGASTRSTAMVSALAHGLPIVAYRGPETPQYLRHRENVFLVDQIDSKCFAAAVAELLAAPDLQRRVGDGARHIYERHMTWPSIANEVLAS
jgi:glycosyltransferase involved in cell wall biosynthesis